MDTGAMLLRAETPIGDEETAGELSERLATLGAEVILDTLARLDTLTPTPQPDGATLAPRLKKSDGAIDWQRPARELVDLVRGCNPWPGATIALDGGALTLWRARVVRRGRSARHARAARPDAWPSPPARARCCPSRSSRRAGGRWRGTSSCAARGWPPARRSRRGDRGGVAGARRWPRACSSVSTRTPPSPISRSTPSSTDAACPCATWRWPPSSSTAPCAGSATWTGSSPRTRAGGWPRSTPAC